MRCIMNCNILSPPSMTAIKIRKAIAFNEPLVATKLKKNDVHGNWKYMTLLFRSYININSNSVIYGLRRNFNKEKATKR